MLNSLAPRGFKGFREATIKRVASADPAAGAEFSLVVPAGLGWEVHGLTAILDQGITDTPRPFIRVLDDAASVVMELVAGGGAQPVSTIVRYSWSRNAPTQTTTTGGTTDGHATAGLPIGLFLPAGWSIVSNTVGLTSTGNWGVASAMVTEFS